MLATPAFDKESISGIYHIENSPILIITYKSLYSKSPLFSFDKSLHHILSQKIVDGQTLVYDDDGHIRQIRKDIKSHPSFFFPRQLTFFYIQPNSRTQS